MSLIGYIDPGPFPDMLLIADGQICLAPEADGHTVLRRVNEATDRFFCDKNVCSGQFCKLRILIHDIIPIYDDQCNQYAPAHVHVIWKIEEQQGRVQT